MHGSLLRPISRSSSSCSTHTLGQPSTTTEMYAQINLCVWLSLARILRDSSISIMLISNSLVVS